MRYAEAQKANAAFFEAINEDEDPAVAAAAAAAADPLGVGDAGSVAATVTSALPYASGAASVASSHHTHMPHKPAHPHDAAGTTPRRAGSKGEAAPRAAMPPTGASTASKGAAVGGSFRPRKRATRFKEPTSLDVVPA